MATVTKGRTFVSGETVTPAKLNELVDNATVTAIQTDNISDSQITTAKIADANVTTAKIADANVTTAKIADANVTAAKIANNAVETAKINNAAITAAKLDGAQTGSAPIYGCRAWVNFDGTAGTTVDGEFRCTIRASGNVSKVVRNSTGNYTLHFTTAMPDTNYAAVMYNNAATGSTAISFQNGLLGGMGDKTTATMGVTSYTDTPSSGYRNSSMFDVIVFR